MDNSKYKCVAFLSFCMMQNPICMQSMTGVAGMFGLWNGLHPPQSRHT